MKRTYYIYSLLLMLVLAFAQTSCGSKEPLGKIPEKPTPNFVPIVFFDAQGNLKSIPMPFVEFGQDNSAIEKWESDHGSTFVKSETRATTNYEFKTNDPTGINPQRSYDVVNGKLVLSYAHFQKELIMSENGNQLKPQILKLFADNGFKSIEKMGMTFYQNDKVAINFSLLGKDRVLAIYKEPFPNSNPSDKFQSIVSLDANGELVKIPYPYVGFDQDGKSELEVWEKEHGSTLIREKEAEGAVMISYKTNDPDYLNEMRIYRYEPNTNGKLTLSTATYRSMLFFDEKGQLKKNVKTLLEKEGYVEFVEMDSPRSISCHNDKIMLTLTFVEGKDYMMALYAPIKKGGSENEKKDSYYTGCLPIFLWNESFAEDGPIWKKEIERKRTVKYTEDLELGNFLVSRASKETDPMLLPITGIYYYDEYGELGADVHYMRSAVCNINESIEVDDPRFAELFEKLEYVLVSKSENEHVYHDKEGKIEASVYKSKQFETVDLYFFPIENVQTKGYKKEIKALHERVVKRSLSRD